MTTTTIDAPSPDLMLQPPSLGRLARLLALDDRLLRRLASHRRARVTFLLRALCRMYDPDVVTMAIVAGLFIPALSVAANYAALSLISSSLLALVVKRLVRRSRPAQEIQASAPPDPFSFPSGHTAGAFALAIGMFGVAPWVVPPMLLVATLVAYARMYLGVHYPLDVAAGAAVGLLSGSLVALW
jgi:undecaprenyl-diphosphatase